ncbi:2OG-Fe(II) oxygenase [Cytobacillus sp. Hz8]|uniref:2OG-Fe(II) oxygenase n=1 Tax=Cytobacillus sp. Hz8 TaxID=3347168 RepID=UPI0035D6A913
MKFNRITNELKDWIENTLKTGVNPELVVDAMIKKGFEPRFAYSTIIKLIGNQPIQTTNNEDSPYHFELPSIAHKGKLIQTSDRQIRVLLSIERPFITYLDNFLSDAECDELISLSNERLQPSKIIDSFTGKEKQVPGRTSAGTYFHVNENAFIAKIEQRIMEITDHPVLHGEGLQVLHYQIGEEYKPHFDYFPPNKVDENKGGQRIGTMLMYLNDVETGGETVFPKLGLAVTPKKGSAVYFHYGNHLGQVDRMSVHSSIPVKAGEKWVATKWIRQNQIYETMKI